MASPPDTRPSESQHYVGFDEYIEFQLAKTRSQIKSTEVFTTLMWAGTLFLSYLLAFVVCDQWVIAGGIGEFWRMLLLGGLLVVLSVMLVRNVALPLLKRVNALYAARVIETADPALHSSLLNFVDLRDAGKPTPKPVLRSIEKRAALNLAHFDVEQAVDRRSLLHVCYLLLGVVVVAGLYTVLSPKDVLTSLKRALLPTSDASVATQTTISDVTPENTTLPARSLLTVEAQIRGKIPETVNLHYTTADHKYVDERVEMRLQEDTNRYRGIITGENGRGLLQDLKYYISAGDARTHDFQVTVVQPPSATVEEIHYRYPTYMQLSPKTQRDGHIDAWEGTEVTLKAVTNMPVTKARLRFSDVEGGPATGEVQELTITGGTHLDAKWTLKIRADGTFPRFYRIDCTTAKGETDPDPLEYSLLIRPDQAPDIALLAPVSDLTMPANGVVPLVIQASDPDFLLRSITLRVQKGSELLTGKWEEVATESEMNQPTFRKTHDFELEKLGLQDGDGIEFWIEAKDNRNPMANRRNTSRLKIQITPPVSPKEAAEELAQEKKRQQDELAKADPAVNPEDSGTPAEAGEKREEGKQDQVADRRNERQRKPKEEQASPENEPQTPETEPGKNDEPADAGGKEGKREKKKYDSSGEDDAQVLQELIDKQQKEQQEQKEQEQKAGGDEGGDQQKGSSQSKGDSDGDPQSSSGSSGGKEKSANKKKSSPSGSGEKSDSKEKNQPPSDAGPSPSPEQKAGQNSKESKPGKEAKPGSAPKPGSDPKTDKPQSNDPENGDQKNGASKPGSESPEKPKPDQQNSGNKPSPKPDNSSDSKSPNPTEKTTDKPTEKPKKEEPGKEGAGKKDETGKKDPAKSEGGKSPESKEKPSGNEGAEKKPSDDGQPDQKNTPEKKMPEDQPGEKNTAEKNTGEKKAGEENGGDKKPDEKKQGDKDLSEKPTPDKAGTGLGSEKKDADKNAGGKKDDSAKGAGQPDADKNETADKSEAGGRGDKGKPDKSSSATPKDEESGEGGGEKTAPRDSKNKPQQRKDENLEGEEKPAEPSPDAVKKKATGDETGKAVPDEKPEGDAPKAKNELEKDPDAKGPRRDNPRPADADPNATKKPNAAKKDGDKGSAEKGSSNPNEAKPAAKRKTDSAESVKSDKAQDGREPQDVKNPPEKQGGQPESGDDELKGNGRKQGQKSDQPQGGEAGGSKQNEQGNQGGNESGAGDRTQQPGKANKAGKKTGEAGQDPGKGSTQQPSDEKSGEGSGKPGSDSSPSGKSGDADSPAGDGPSSKLPGEGKKEDGRGKAGGSEPGDGTGESDGETESADAPNLEYARKQSNLVLQKLKDQLDRGEVDQKQLDDLGWTKEDMKRFVDRLDKQVNDTDNDTSPDATARRLQFEEDLKTLKLNRRATAKKGDDAPRRRTQQVRDARQTPVPAEYREQYEAYTKSLSQQGAKPAAAKPAPASPAPAKSK